jgi:amino acid permease
MMVLTLSQALVCLNTFGLAVAVIVVGGNGSPRVFAYFEKLYQTDVPGSPYFLSRTLWVTMIVVALMPLCYARDITRLGWTGITSSAGELLLMIGEGSEDGDGGCSTL